MIYVFLADGFEEVEAFTPVDFLRRLDLKVQTVGVRGKMVRGSHGITTITDATMYDVDVEQIEMIVLPGGMPGTLNLEKSKLLKNTILHCAENDIPIAAICAAPSILGHLGLLKDKKATCFPGYEEELNCKEVSKANIVIDGKIITAKSAGYSDEFAFAIGEYFCSDERVDKLRASLQIL